jgi:ParB-like chromosome segregation protein Spo0J
MTNKTQETLQFHPLADMFEMMEGKEFDALVADIKAHGLNEPITLFKGMVLDGRNRARACSAAGVKPRYHEIGGNEADARAFVVSANIKRRHLKPKEKSNLLKKLVAAEPELSDRQHAKRAGVDHKTIAKARKKGEATGEVSPVGKRKGADNKTRAVARKPRPSNRLTKKGRKAADAAPITTEEVVAAAAQATLDLEKQLADDRKWARDLVKLDRHVARSLHDILMNQKRRDVFLDALITALKSGSDGNAADPEASATNMGAKFAALDADSKEEKAA